MLSSDHGNRSVQHLLVSYYGPWQEGGFRCVWLIGMKSEKQFLALVIRLHSWVMFVFATDPNLLLV